MCYVVSQGRFRPDLFYRISVIPLHLPPLRQRRGDIPLLAAHFLGEIDGQLGRTRRFSAEAEELLCRYPWPGNIRELKNCVERMAILSADNSVISTESMPRAILEYNSFETIYPGKPHRLRETLEKTERDTIEAVLRLTLGNKARAIEILGISKRNFYLKLAKYNLK